MDYIPAGLPASRLLYYSARHETVQYASTFGTFEITKRALMHATHASPDSLTGVGAVAAAGELRTRCSEV